MTVTLHGAGLTEDQVVAVARHGDKVALAAAARTKMERSRERVERAAASREPVYGVSTGFGALAGTRIVTRSHADSRLTRRPAKRMNGVRSRRSNPPGVLTGM